jgi:hypothetical protein
MMNTRQILAVAVLAVLVSACYDIYSPSQIHRTVQMDPTVSGHYVVDYKWYYVIEEFGPGVEKVRDVVRQSTSPTEIATAWNQALAVAVPKYLTAKHITPATCVNGVVIIESRFVEGGGGWSRFRCKDPNQPSG